MNKIRFIGDVHGKILSYKKIIDDCESSVQIGDFGVGFYPLEKNKIFKDVKGNHRFIRGNHDNPCLCKVQKTPKWISDGTIENFKNCDIVYIGGAYSIDKNQRTPMVDWWENEELSENEFEKIKKQLTPYFENEKPIIFVTHDAPSIAADVLAKNLNIRTKIINRTSHYLNEIFLNFKNKPKFWIFGHWHKNFDYVIDGTRFLCLAELSFIDFDLEKIKIN